jgi:protocatechuate 3,4-dioxygenase beta subunit
LRLSVTELTGPKFSDRPVQAWEHDLTRDGPIGERIVVHGTVRDGSGRPVPHSVIELWQTNAAGRYAHPSDTHPAPLDPGFTGVGRCVTDAGGHYRFVSIKPGAYPWRNHDNAWRPAHIHFSLFGRAFTQRLITQMYFPGDPLFGQDPIFNSVPAFARDRLVGHFDLSETVPEWALGYRFDIVLSGQSETPVEPR